MFALATKAKTVLGDEHITFRETDKKSKQYPTQCL